MSCVGLQWRWLRFLSVGAMVAILGASPLVFADSGSEPVIPTMASVDGRDVGTDDARMPAQDPHGVKSFLVKKAVELIAAAFRHGGDVLSYILKWVDDDAAKAISKNGGKIANALDDIARIPNLTTQIVREKLYYFLTNSLSLSGGTSLQIADAVATAINWLVF